MAASIDNICGDNPKRVCKAANLFVNSLLRGAIARSIALRPNKSWQTKLKVLTWLGAADSQFDGAILSKFRLSSACCNLLGSLNDDSDSGLSMGSRLNISLARLVVGKLCLIDALGRAPAFANAVVRKFFGSGLLFLSAISTGNLGVNGVDSGSCGSGVLSSCVKSALY